MHSGTETVLAISNDGFVINQVGDTKENQKSFIVFFTGKQQRKEGRLSLHRAGKVAVSIVIYRQICQLELEP